LSISRARRSFPCLPPLAMPHSSKLASSHQSQPAKQTQSETTQKPREIPGKPHVRNPYKPQPAYPPQEQWLGRRRRRDT
jgi:hypothetical protein